MRKKPNVLIIGLIALLVIVQIVFLLPSRIEVSEENISGMYPSIETQMQAQKNNDEVKYTLTNVRYSSVEDGAKQWSMRANEAVVFNKTNVLVAEKVKMKMYDPQEKITEIESDHAYFRVGSKELDMEGNLKVTFPDNFWIQSDKAHYSAVDQRFSTQDPFYGESKSASNETIRIWGDGFLGSKTGSDIYVLKNSRVQMKKPMSNEVTDVRSDRSKIDRFRKVVDFTMGDGDRYVESNQGTLYIRSKNQNALYDSGAKSLNYLTANDDVLIRELDRKKSANGMKYATSQKAEFYAQQNKIVLSGFPSVYQESDTVAGEMITVYRNTNVVEVTDANAYHEGTK